MEPKCCTKQPCSHEPQQFWQNINGSLRAYCKHHPPRWLAYANDQGWKEITKGEYYVTLIEEQTEEV